MIIPLLGRNEDTNGNLGDIIIWHGLRYLLNKKFDNPKILLINKFSEDDFKKHIPKLMDIGYFIFAGTPQFNCLSDWSFFWDKQLFTKYCLPYQIDCLSIAGGSGSASKESPKEFAKRLLADKQTRSILEVRELVGSTLSVRDKFCSALFEEFGRPTKLLGCTGYFAIADREDRREHLLITLPGPNNYARQDTCSYEDLVGRLKSVYKLAKKDGMNPKFLSPGTSSGNKIQKYLEGYDHIIASGIEELEDSYSRATGSIGCRIHTAIPLAYHNKPSVILPVDTRYTACTLFGIKSLPIDVGAELLYETWKAETQKVYTYNPEGEYMDILDRLNDYY